jgi:hypothetical protein
MRLMLGVIAVMTGGPSGDVNVLHCWNHDKENAKAPNYHIAICIVLESVVLPTLYSSNNLPLSNLRNPSEIMIPREEYTRGDCSLETPIVFSPLLALET